MIYLTLILTMDMEVQIYEDNHQYSNTCTANHLFKIDDGLLTNVHSCYNVHIFCGDEVHRLGI